jgi:hypothetical protein
MSRKTTITLDPLDDQAIQGVKTRYGGSDSAAIRLSLRVLAASPILELQPPLLPMNTRRMTFWAETADDEAIQVIINRYNPAKTTSAAIRLALHALVKSPMLTLQGEPTP